jgi:hypothetical protein
MRKRSDLKDGCLRSVMTRAAPLKAAPTNCFPSDWHGEKFIELSHTKKCAPGAVNNLYLFTCVNERLRPFYMSGDQYT